MSTISVSDMLDRMGDYEKVLTTYGYEEAGEGTKPWSARWVNPHDGTIVDTRLSEWTLYTRLLVSAQANGPDPSSLANYLEEH